MVVWNSMLLEILYILLNFPQQHYRFIVLHPIHHKTGLNIQS